MSGKRSLKSFACVPPRSKNAVMSRACFHVRSCSGAVLGGFCVVLLPESWSGHSVEADAPDLRSCTTWPGNLNYFFKFIFYVEIGTLL